MPGVSQMQLESLTSQLTKCIDDAMANAAQQHLRSTATHEDVADLSGQIAEGTVAKPASSTCFFQFCHANDARLDVIECCFAHECHLMLAWLAVNTAV